MADTYTTSNRFEKMEPGQYLDTWGARWNAQGGSDLIDAALDGVEDFALSGSKTLTNNNGAADEARKRGLDVTSGTGGTITIPNVAKIYFVRNGSSGDVIITTGSGTTATIKAGLTKWVMCDGSNNVYQTSGPDFGSAAISTTGTLASGAQTVTGTVATTDAISVVKNNNADFNGVIVMNSNSGASSVARVRVVSDSATIILSSYGTGVGTYGGKSTIETTAGNIVIRPQGTPVAELSATGGVYFPVHAITASAANAFINTGSSPVGQLARSTSSEWYKTGIENVEQKYLDAALSIRAVYYRPDPEHAPNDNPNHGYWGHIAEEVAAIDPRLVHWGFQERDYETYTYELPATVETGELDDDGNPIIATVMQPQEGTRLKEGAALRPDGAQYERINVLKIEALKRKVEALEARLAKLEAA